MTDDALAAILARRTGRPVGMPQTTIGSAKQHTVTGHQLHEAVYHSVTINRPAGMSKTAAHQLAGRVAEMVLGLIVTQEKDGP